MSTAANIPASNNNQKKISFRAKEATKCPVCGATHFKEELLSGGGRLIAGKLTPELRRLYEESKKWGKIEPLVYHVQVCPKCLYAAFPKDFSQLNPGEILAIKNTTQHRQKVVETFFGKYDMGENRNLVHGAISYMLNVDCYHLRGNQAAPTPKKAVSALRAAWLLDDLYREASYRPYDKLRDFYYIEAARCYKRVLDTMTSGIEPIEEAAYLLGPSLDFNWQFDGVIYLNSYLTRKFIDQMATTPKDKYNILDGSRRYLSKLYGTGKASRSRPSVIIDMAKDLYDEIGKLMEQYRMEFDPAYAEQKAQEAAKPGG
ncbi:MAG: DUF2225 domain-containing protein [Turneriella sp.]|nr:DUF2225 domain-containing protein [Turneriella sp.]